MTTRRFCLGVSLAVLLSGCGTNSPESPQENVAPAETGKVTFLVKGMMDQFNIL